MPILTKLRESKEAGVPMELSQEDVIEILKNREKLLKDCEEKKKEHIKKIREINLGINDLKNVEYNSACMIREKECELRSAYEEELVLVCHKETIINNVWLQFLRLPYMFRTILETLYVDKKGWKYAEAELGIGKTKLCTLRKNGIEKLCEPISTIWNQ